MGAPTPLFYGSLPSVHFLAPPLTPSLCANFPKKTTLKTQKDVFCVSEVQGKGENNSSKQSPATLSLGALLGLLAAVVAVAVVVL